MQHNRRAKSPVAKSRSEHPPQPKKRGAPPDATSTLAVQHPDAAGIDVGGSVHYVCVPADRDQPCVRRFGSDTASLQEMADWLGHCKVRQVALEATGVYWIGLYEFLEAHGFEPMLVNGQQTRRRATGRKSDVLDCQWIQQLMTFGLLTGSFRPDQATCALRSVVRLRRRLRDEVARAGQQMDKALVQMNVHLGRVISDITGVSGLAIVRAILDGQRDPAYLVTLCDRRLKAKPDHIARQLVGHWRSEHLLALKLALATYDHLRAQIRECDADIDRRLAALQRTDTPVPAPRCLPRNCKVRSTAAHAALREALFQAALVDLTAIPTIDVDTAMVILSEVGTDLSRFPTADHFCSWLTLAPGTCITGGKRIAQAPQPTLNRAGHALRKAAVNARTSETFIGAAHRKRLARMPKACAIKATAHQIARIIYAMLTRGQPYVEQGIAGFEERNRQRQLRNLHHQAKKLGVKVVDEAA